MQFTATRKKHDLGRISGIDSTAGQQREPACGTYAQIGNKS